MASGTFSSGAVAKAAAPLDIAGLAWLAMRAVGSLKITVGMFALGTLILFVGTLAQDEETIVDVKKQYFNSWVASVPFDVFMPQTIFPHDEPIPYAFAIPGGAAVGLILLINLIAAKMTRFAMNAKGGRFVAGLFFTIVGFALVGLIVVSAHLGDGLQGEPPFTYDWLWAGVKGSVWGLAAASLVWCIGWSPKTRVVRWTVWSITTILFGVSIFLIATNDAFRIPDPGLRIVWQLSKSLIVSAVLLVGVLLLFGNRGGNVLIHLGVGLLMLGQFIFGDAQREERIAIFEGQRTQVAYEMDTVELVFIDKSDPEKNHVVAFEHPMLERSAAKGTFLSSANLPFEIRVDRWMTNSTREDRKSPAKPSDDDYKLTGVASRDYVFKELSKSGGAKSQSNFATAYVTLRNKEDQTTIGSYAVSQLLNDDAILFTADYEKVEAAGKTWDFGLRFRRNYKPYSIVLDDVQLEEYTGTMKAKDYSSIVKINDEKGDTLQQGRIWMNNPMRYRGETFYQSGYMKASQNPYNVEQTTLQVVTNAGWLIPYVACVLSGLGMLVHFGGTFGRFASRYDRKAYATPAETAASSETKNAKAKRLGGTAKQVNASPMGWMIYVIPFVLCGALAIWVGMRASTPKVDRDEIDWYAFGEIPTQYGGRIKPLSSAASEVLEILSNKKFALSNEGHVYEPVHKTGKAIDATQWIAGVFAREDWVLDSPLIRIDAVETTTAFGLRRHKSNRYSYSQIAAGRPKIREQFEKLRATKREEWTFEQTKLAETLEKLSTFESLLVAYTPRSPRDVSDASQIVTFLQQMQPDIDDIRERSPIAIIPPIRDAEVKPGEKAPPAKWDAFGPALFETVKLKTMGIESKTASVLKFMELEQALGASTKNASKINALVSDFKADVQKEFGSSIRTAKIPFEAWYEYFSPVSIASTLYPICGIIAMFSFIFARHALRRTAFWICVLTLLVHTIAIVSRVYISERPPVVTLYSAAVFIGWAMVLFCTVTEILFPVSISVLVASVTGYLTLQVANGLAIGDTMPVLEAVLDTQFWLSTHVISVSLGYSATFVAGFLGIGLVIAAMFERLGAASSGVGVLSRMGAASTEAIPTLYRICYGVVCFGLFFSFVGTVLGGLWGDDSWGRFWGWDPKENGAMMIVLWNALLLHARWDKMIASLGFGILAVFGNIITAWSMFGTNLLGVGLHTYGFNKDTYNYLVYFALSQAIVICVGVVVVLLRGASPKAELS